MGVEVFRGNRQEATPVMDKIRELQRDYNVLNCLAAIRQETVTLKGVTFQQRTTPNTEQKYILELIAVKMLPCR